VIWATNVIAFGLWYWDLDRGAAARAHHPNADPAFVFPEMQHTDYVPATWVPKLMARAGGRGQAARQAQPDSGGVLGSRFCGSVQRWWP
jgi:hypothetical protein